MRYPCKAHREPLEDFGFPDEAERRRGDDQQRPLLPIHLQIRDLGIRYRLVDVEGVVAPPNEGVT